jgi:hypothetical protein
MNGANIAISTLDSIFFAYEGTKEYYLKNGKTTGKKDKDGKLKATGDEYEEGSKVAFKIGTKFAIKKDGTLYAKNAQISGNTTAKSGTIGGWTIKNNQLKASYKDGKQTHYCAIQAPKSINTNVIAIGSKSGNSYSQAAFRVDTKGHLTATNATIKGKITATSGKIGGCTINENGKLIIDDGHIKRLSFDKIVDGSKTSKKLTASNFNMTGGSITFGKVFNITKNGTCRITNKVGFFAFGPGIKPKGVSSSLKHPYVSGLNVSMANGIAFWGAVNKSEEKSIGIKNIGTKLGALKLNPIEYTITHTNGTESSHFDYNLVLSNYKGSIILQCGYLHNKAGTAYLRLGADGKKCAIEAKNWGSSKNLKTNL